MKFPTIISRNTDNTIKSSLLFFRTSEVSRSRPKFLRESAMLPPRAYTACIQTLHNLQRRLPNAHLELHFADEEGDPYAVELAARLGGYVVGRDSDFVILNAEGYQGYVSFDEMVWSSGVAEEASVLADDWADDDGFQTVINSKSKKKAIMQQDVGRGIIPPDRNDGDPLELSVLVYSPSDLAAHLQIPLSLLPLLAALVGNDFTGIRQDITSATTSQLTNLQWLFFERQLTLSQRITRVSTTLRSILSAAFPSSGKKAKNRDKTQVRSVMDLIDRAVTALVVRNLDSMASGERERIVERIVEATLQYAIPKFEGESGQERTSDVCSLHRADACPLVLVQISSTDAQPPSVSESASVPTSPAVVTETDALDGAVQQLSPDRALYLSAYRSGYLDPHTLDILHSGTFWYRQFLENPDFEAVAKAFARPIQMWTYAVLEEVVGIPERVVVAQRNQKKSDAESGEEEQEEEEDEDELIDVIEQSDTEDDPLAPLRGALQQLNGSSFLAHAALDDRASVASSQRDGAATPVHRPRKLVEEYLRRGTRLAAEDVEVLPLAELLGLHMDQDHHSQSVLTSSSP